MIFNFCLFCVRMEMEHTNPWYVSRFSVTFGHLSCHDVQNYILDSGFEETIMTWQHYKATNFVFANRMGE